METLQACFAAGAPEDPAAPMLIVPGGATVSYGEARVRSGQIASVLRGAGVVPGDRVAVVAEKSATGVMLYLACLRVGAIFLPMNPASTDEEAAYIFADAAPSVIVHDPARFVSGPPDAARRFTSDVHGDGTLATAAAAYAAKVDDRPDHDPTPGDVATILYTSGTTGRPKGAMLTQRNLASNATTLCSFWGFAPDDVVLHALPIFHAHGLFVAVNCSLVNGTPMLFLPRFDVDAVLTHLREATVFMGVPTYYARLLADRRFDAEACRAIRLFISGSAPLLAEVHRRFEQRSGGHRIIERYGMTETSMIASNPLVGERRSGTVGFPLPGVDVRVTRSTDEADVGDIEVRGPNVFSGYWRQPDLTAQEFTADGFFRTGDLGSFDAEGYLTIVGRSKDLVITGGLNVYPKEVEQALDALDGIDESAVIGVPDPDFGEAVIAIVVRSAARRGEVFDEAHVRDELKGTLAGYKVPKRVIVVDALPRNAMGKVEKARLRKQFDPGG